MSDLEKKLNKLFLDFIIGGNYMSDGAQHFMDKIKKNIVAMYEHLMFYRRKFIAWRNED